MTAALATSAQIQALQASRRRAGIDDDTWRARLLQSAGVSSTKALTSDQAGRLLHELRGRRDSPSDHIAGPYATKARALWISAYWLGVVDDRTDKALLAWVQRQTGYPTLAWVRDSRDGVRVIEGLKDWVAREGGVDWASPYCHGEPKRAVLHAIFERLSDTGEWRWLPGAGRIGPIEEWAAALKAGAPTRPAMRDWTDAEVDRVIQAAGRWLRKALERQRAQEARDRQGATS